MYRHTGIQIYRHTGIQIYSHTDILRQTDTHAGRLADIKKNRKQRNRQADYCKGRQTPLKHAIMEKINLNLFTVILRSKNRKLRWLCIDWL